jgi:hypothetical protein
LHDVLKKNAFSWSSTQQAAFEELKQAMTTTLVMALPNFQLPFTLKTNASVAELGTHVEQTTHCTSLVYL